MATHRIQAFKKWYISSLFTKETETATCVPTCVPNVENIAFFANSQKYSSLCYMRLLQPPANAWLGSHRGPLFSLSLRSSSLVSKINHHSWWVVNQDQSCQLHVRCRSLPIKIIHRWKSSSLGGWMAGVCMKVIDIPKDVTPVSNLRKLSQIDITQPNFEHFLSESSSLRSIIFSNNMCILYVYIYIYVYIRVCIYTYITYVYIWMCTVYVPPISAPCCKFQGTRSNFTKVSLCFSLIKLKALRICARTKRFMASIEVFMSISNHSAIYCTWRNHQKMYVVI